MLQLSPTEACPPLTLFEWAHIDLPDGLVGGRDFVAFAKLSRSRKSKTTSDSEPLPPQRRLALEIGTWDNVSGFVTKDHYSSLGRHLGSLVQNDPQLSRLAALLSHDGHLYLGDIVPLRHAKVFDLLGTDIDAMERLLGLLKKFDLGLNKSVSRTKWASPGGLVCETW